MQAQRSFDDLGTPLAEVTFCVVDLETTGGSPATSEITEVGAIKVCRGESVGTFHTLVNPGRPVPAFIRLLTGIADEMLIEAPSIAAVLPSFLEFSRETVLVAHNARFDVGFLNAALRRHGYPTLANRVVDTAQLARKILGGEVPNNRLKTLAHRLRCAHQPRHRAYADVLATTDVLHHLIERVAGFGVTTLDDLLAMSTARLDGTFSKIKLSDGIPSRAGVYRFVGAQGRTLYVGKASNLRSRVRSYFYGDPRRKIRDLLRQTETIQVQEFPTMLQAEVAEARAIRAELPTHNRAGKKVPAWYVKVTPSAPVPKIARARVVKGEGVFLGPFTSRTATTLIDALRDALPVHRCSDPARCHGCAFSEMNRCPGARTEEHRAAVGAAADAVTRDPSGVLDALCARMKRLARTQRYEEAAEVRAGGALLERTLCRSIEVAAWIAAGEIVLLVSDEVVTIRYGVLHDLDADVPPAEAQREARLICSWIGRHAEETRLLSVSGTWAIPVTAAPSGRFEPVTR